MAIAVDIAGANPVFVGPLKTTADTLEPPPTNGQLKTIAGPSYTFTCVSSIVLSGTNLTVTSYGFTGTKAVPRQRRRLHRQRRRADCATARRSWSACPSLSSPFKATYSKEVKCGNVYVSGKYSGRLTIAADNDIIINGNLIREGSGMLGLIANNFIRVWHPYPTETGPGSCGSGTGAEGITNLQIDASLLAIAHSFIVDHYDCGAGLGTLTVNGSISQNFRGPVGLVSGAGIHQELHLRRPPPLHGAAELPRTGQILVANPARDAGLLKPQRPNRDNWRSAVKVCGSGVDSSAMVSTATGTIFAFFGGAMSGSFLSVVAHRVPRGESIVAPRSRCSSCGATIAAYDNIPIVSWLLLRGRCRQLRGEDPGPLPAGRDRDRDRSSPRPLSSSTTNRLSWCSASPWSRPWRPSPSPTSSCG